VYRIYGVHWCLNAVTDSDGHPAAVLIRAIEPSIGIDEMHRRRGQPRAAAHMGVAGTAGFGTNGRRGKAHPPTGRWLTGGPGRLAQALGITGEFNHHTLDRPPLLFVAGTTVADSDVVMSTRIGVRQAADWPLRFYVRGNPCVSR
jgi:DNA-3-methyladenine glycosylase